MIKLQIVIAIALMLSTVLTQAQTQITTAEELAAINTDATSLGGRYTLMNDITVENWIPIGHVRAYFNGAFDGNGYTITIKSISPDVVSTTRPFKFQGTGIPAAMTQTYFIGLFGSTGKRCVIKNLRVDGDVTFDSGEKDNVTGGIVGEHYGVISNCISSADITASGGFFNKKLKVWTQYSGGCYAGGIAGISFGTIRNSYTTGTVSVSGKSTRCAGGIAGSGTIIDNCYASGNISVLGEGAARYVGGIAGYTSDALRSCVALNEKITIEGENVKWTVDKTDFISRIVGEKNGKFTNCFARGDMQLSKKEKIASTPVTYMQTQEKEWWIGTPRKFEFLFGTDEKTPWAWDETSTCPVLYWETDAFTPKSD